MCIKNIIKALILCCCCLTLFAQADISGTETADNNNHCQLCVHTVPYNCSTEHCGVTTVTQQIISEYKLPRETYPGSPRSVCIPCDCGNHKDDNGEQCDDGNNVGFDGCTADCKKEICGDGIKQPRNYYGVAEECDNGTANNKNLPDHCRPTCKNPFCGDNIKDTGEQCDLGSSNANGLNGCSLDCKKILCGDGVTNGAEVCDDGDKDNNDECTNACVRAKCNDGFIQTGVETCDGNIFGTKPAGITDAQWAAKKCNPTTCQVEYNPCCGDGVKGPGEDCDGTQFGPKPAGVTEAQWIARRCDTSCKINYGGYCGNGKRDTCPVVCDHYRAGYVCAAVCEPEICDGNEFGAKPANVTDAQWAAKTCSASCDLAFGPFCGDKIKNGTEGCDGSQFGTKPANVSDAKWAAKTCNQATCTVEYGPHCGDGVKAANEVCDGTQFGEKPANVSDAQWAAKLCNASCNLEFLACCGDGVKGPNEECDGTQFGTKPANVTEAQWAVKTCSSACHVGYGPYCGDGKMDTCPIIQCPPGMVCPAVCKPEKCDGTQFGDKPANVTDAQWATKTCSASCDLAFGPYCGDNIKNGTEACDGTQFGAKPANISQAQWNVKTCSATCDLAFGPYCGDNIKNGTEACDGTQFGDKPAGMTDAKWATKTCSASCTVEFPKTCADVPLAELTKTIKCAHSGAPNCVVNDGEGSQFYWRNYRGTPDLFSHEWGNMDEGLYKIFPDGSISLDTANNVTDTQKACWTCACDRNSGGCFDPEAKISLADGTEKSAQDIEVGDEVVTATGTAKITRVLQGSEEIDLVHIKLGDRVLKVSQNHVFATKRGYVRAETLTADDYVVVSDGTYEKIEDVNLSSPQIAQQVINFELDTDSEEADDHLILSEGIYSGDLYLQNNLD